MNYTEISFPGLGITWNPDKALSIGSLSFHYYGILIALGLILAVVYAWKRSKEFGIRSDDLTDGVLWIVPFAVICARLYYCAFKWDDYAADPLSILYIWKGGLAIYGGVIGAAIGVTVFAKARKIKLPALLDLVAIGFLIGQCIGRWGNFFNREAFGAETDWFLRMGLLNASTNTVEYYHPTFLYVVWYGFGRTMIEALRTDSLYWGMFRVSQLLAAVSCFAAAVVMLVMMVREHDPKKLFVNQVAAAAEAAALAVEEAAEEAEEAAEEEPSEEEVEEVTEEAAPEEAAEESAEETEE